MITYTPAVPADLSGIYRLVHEVWPHDPDVAKHTALRLNSPKHQAAEWFVGKDGDTIVTSLGVFPLLLKMGSGVEPAYSIGCVHTPTVFRGKKYASNLLSYTLDHMAQRGLISCVLYSDIDPGFYGRFGFRLSPAYSFRLDHRLANACTLKPLSWHQDPALRHRLWQRSLKNYETAIERSESGWQWHSQRYPDAAGFVVTNGDEIEGGILVRKEGEVWSLLDFVLPDASQALAVLGACGERGLLPLTGWWPWPDPPQLPQLLFERCDGIPMLRSDKLTEKSHIFLFGQGSDHV